MDLRELTEYIVKSIVNDTDSVVVEKSEDNKTLYITITVAESNKSKLIGRGGKVINSIRTLVQEASTLRNDKYVKIEVSK